MRANSKVAILVVSMFVLTALAPAVTVLCGSEDVNADTITGVTSAKATIFTEKSEDYNSLIYLSDKFPVNASNLDISNWRYDDVCEYWVYVNKDTSTKDSSGCSYGDILTYNNIQGMSITDIRQDIVDKYYRDDIVDLKGDKYKVSGGSIEIGTKSLTYSKVGNDITIQTSGVTIVAALDVLGRSVFPLTPITYDHLTIDYDGNITVYNGSTPVIESAYQIVVNDGVTNYYLVRNVDASSAKFQLLQVDFETNASTKVSVNITKTGADAVAYTVNADMTCADCYFDAKLQYSSIKTIDPIAGDIQPSKYTIEGTYTVSIQDGYGNKYTPTAVLGNRGFTVYGSVTDADGSISGYNVTNALYGAVVTYHGTDASGEAFDGSVIVSSTTDESGNVRGFYKIEVSSGSKLTITNVACTGYSFIDPTWDYGTINGDIDPVASDLMHIFKAREHTKTITVLDQTGSPAVGCYVNVEWWYQYSTGNCTTTYPEEAGGDPGSLPVKTLTSDSNGVVSIPYAEPTMVNYILLVWGIRDPDTSNVSTYTFEVDDKSGWASSTTLPTSLTEEGNLILVASGFTPSETTIKAKEYSFTVTAKSNNTRTLENASVSATWYYRGKTDPNKRNTDNLANIYSSLLATENAGTAKAITTSGSDGVIKVVYLPVVLEAGHWNGLDSVFLYVYGTGYNFSYNTAVTTLETDPDATAGAQVLSYYSGSGGQPDKDKFIDSKMPNKTVVSDDDSWTISGAITAHSGDLPLQVKVIVTISSSSKEYYIYRSGTSSLTYSFKVVGGSVPEISMVSEGYSFSCTVPSIGKIVSDRTIDYISDYVGISTLYREQAVVIGVSTGYTVNGIQQDVVVNYTYTVGGKDRSTLVKATSTSVNYVVKGKSGMEVSMTASDVNGDYYVEEFDSSGMSTATKLKETKNVVYKGSIDNVLISTTDPDKYTFGFTVYYKGEEFTQFVTDPKTGTATVKVPENNVTYVYNNYSITPTAITSGKYAGYLGFDMSGYTDPGIGESVTVTIEYYATSSIDNLSSATCKPIVYVNESNPTSATIVVGSSKTFVAPTLEGFKFAGWYLNGEYYSSATDVNVCTLMAESDMGSDVTLRAYYSALSASESEKSQDTTVIIVGVIAVVIALVAVIYVVIQSRR